MESMNNITIEAMFEHAPKSEQTIIKHKFKWLGCEFRNDLGHPCEYRVIDKFGHVLGMIKYYRGRLLSCYELQKIEPR